MVDGAPEPASTALLPGIVPATALLPGILPFRFESRGCRHQKVLTDIPPPSAARTPVQEGLADAIGNHAGFGLRKYLVGPSQLPVCWNQKAPRARWVRRKLCRDTPRSSNPPKSPGRLLPWGRAARTLTNSVKLQMVSLRAAAVAITRATQCRLARPTCSERPWSARDDPRKGALLRQGHRCG